MDNVVENHEIQSIIGLINLKKNSTQTDRILIAGDGVRNRSNILMYLQWIFKENARISQCTMNVQLFDVYIERIDEYLQTTY